MKITAEINNKISLFAKEMNLAINRRDYESVKVINSEYFNFIAQEAKRQNDKIPIYLMSLVEDLGKESESCRTYFYGLLTIYLSGGIGSLEIYCNSNIPFLLKALSYIQQSLLIQLLENEK